MLSNGGVVLSGIGTSSSSSLSCNMDVDGQPVSYHSNSTEKAHHPRQHQQVMIRSDGRCFVLPRSGGGYNTNNGGNASTANNNSSNNGGSAETEEPPVSRTYQYRKVMKPMLERKRRARINRCLDELKELMLTALQAEGENVSKLEKADILELTVRHLHKLRRQRALNLTGNVGSGSSSSSSSCVGNNNNNNSDNFIETASSSYLDRFRAGFTHCASEVTQYLTSVIQQQHLLQQQQQPQQQNESSTRTIEDCNRNDNNTKDDDNNYDKQILIDHTSSVKLLQHLGSCIQRIENTTTVNSFSSRSERQISAPPMFSPPSYATPPTSPSPCDSRIPYTTAAEHNVQRRQQHNMTVWRPW